MRAIVLLALAALGSCATQYQPQGFTGGFSESRISEDVYRVTFNGNGFTSPDRVSDFALLRSAELTLKSGYRFFIIGGSENRTTTGAYVTPRTTNASAYGSGNYAYGNATTYGGNVIPIIKPGVAFIIQCFTEKPAGMAFDAVFLADSLGKKYGVSVKVPASTAE